MSEKSEPRSSRLRNLGLIPAYYYGFSGDGPASVTSTTESPSAYSTPNQRSFAPPQRFPVVEFVRDSFDSVREYVSPGTSPLVVKLGTLMALFVGGYVVLRVAIAIVTGALGSVIGFFIHKAAGPMFMGFLAVGSTWGIHQTIAEQFGLTWAATTVSLTAAIAALFALAGVQTRG